MPSRFIAPLSVLVWACAAAWAAADIGPIAIPSFTTGFFPPHQFTAVNQPAGQTIHGVHLSADWSGGSVDAWSAFFRMFPTAPGNKVGSTLDYGGRTDASPYHFDASRYLVFPGGAASGGDWKLSFSMTLPGTTAQLSNVGVTLLDNPVASYSNATTGGPTWHRPHEGFTNVDSELIAYHVQPFEVGATGRYDIFSSQDFDGMLFLYAGGFDPLSPLSFGYADNDDGRTGIKSSDIWLDGAGDPMVLSAGTTYYLVTTGLREDDFGTFTSYIGGEGDVTFVPEPGSFALVFGAVLATLPSWRRRGRP